MSSAPTLTAADVAVVSRAYAARDLADYQRTWVADEGVADSSFNEALPRIERADSHLVATGWLAAAG